QAHGARAQRLPVRPGDRGAAVRPGLGGQGLRTGPLRAASAHLAVDAKIEDGQLAHAMGYLKRRRNDPLVAPARRPSSPRRSSARRSSCRNGSGTRTTSATPSRSWRLETINRPAPALTATPALSPACCASTAALARLVVGIENEFSQAQEVVHVDGPVAGRH